MRAQVAYLTLGRALGSVVQAVIVLILARVVSLDEFGILNTVLNAGLVFAAVGEFGVSTFLARARAQGQLSDVAGCVRLNRWSSLFAGLIFSLAIIAFLSGSQLSFYFALLAVALTIEKNVDCLLSISVADGDKIVPAISIAIRRLICLGVFVSLILVRAEPILSYSLSYLLGALAGQVHVAVALRHTRKEWSSVHPRGMREILRAALPFFASNIAGQSRMLDVPVIAGFAGSTAAGLYAGANKIVGPFGLIPGVVTTVILPHASRLSPEGALTLVKKLVVGSLVLTALLAIPVPFSATLCALLLGDQFRDAGGALAWALLGLPAICLSSPLGSVLQAKGHEKFVARNGLVFAVATLLAVAAGSVVSGASGAALAMTLCFTLKCVALFIGASSLLPRTIARTGR